MVSDGTPVLRILDPENFAVRRTLAVTEGGRPLRLLNDLAFVSGELLANIFMTDTIARIDPATGAVSARIDLSDIVPESGRRDIRDVLNGIAYDEAGRAGCSSPARTGRRLLRDQRAAASAPPHPVHAGSLKSITAFSSRTLR